MALAFSLIAATIIAGVGTLAVSHFSRARVEADNAMAMQLAEAGIDYELRNISLDPTNPNQAHQQAAYGSMPGPFTSSISGVDGSFTVYVTNDDSTGTGPWVSYDASGMQSNGLRIVSTGTVNGVTRTVRITGARKSLFDEYAIFAYKKGNYSGAGASDGSTRIVGDLGTNGSLTFNGSSGTETIVGEISLHTGASTNTSGTNLVSGGAPIVLPTVSDIANTMFPSGGLTYLKTHNSNANIKMLNKSGSVIDQMNDITTIAAFTSSVMNARLVSAGYTTSTYTLSDPQGNTAPSDACTYDQANGTRFASSRPANSDPAYVFTSQGAYGCNVLFLPPGDYYFNSLDLKQQNTALVLLTHLGNIRIWVDNPSGKVSDDTLKATVIFTDTTPSRFRLFYNKLATLTINGSSQFCGSFYAINSAGGTDLPNLNFNGNSSVYGSVIANNMTIRGGTQVIFPNDGSGADPADLSLWYGFKSGWIEIAKVSGNPVFSDGTRN